MSDIAEQIGDLKLVPVVAIKDAADAPRLADALVAGGLPCAEITFRTEAAEAAIKAMATRGDMLVGAGTVLTTEQAQRAIDAGAKFLVSPGTNPKVVEYAINQSTPIVPGVATPTDIELAMNLGLDTLKFFPAEANGGVKMLKAISAPYGMIKFLPTGGITAANLASYLDLPQVIACGGSWMVKGDLISEGKFDEITRLTREAVQLAGQVSAH
jgi:2-dehydro-3-deoxyphosphogluconate aldolase/(4S)-4-hydroxy-2-oxoglutarate aldolase